MDIELIVGLGALFGTELYNAIQITKLKVSSENCVYCQKSKNLVKELEKVVK